MTRLHIHPESLDFTLPEERIAQEPLAERDAARLMVVDRRSGEVSHRRFRDLLHVLHAGDVVVINKAKVNRARLFGRKETSGKVEVLLISEESPARWKALVRPLLREGTPFSLGDGAKAILESRTSGGENIIRFETGDPRRLLEREGVMPLPPYIKRGETDPRNRRDAEDYQTVYASTEGSLAAPTAGLHFTADLVQNLKKKGVLVVPLVLHVGWGTFKPISSGLHKHVMLPERFEMATASLHELRKARAEGRRVIAVGTTVTRVLESLPDDVEEKDLSGETNLFIRPGYEFRWISGLITNFHVPRSTPIALTAAFVGLSKLEEAYNIALYENYRFFSYGDAMIIL